MLSLLAFSSMLLTKDLQLQEISLSEFLNNYLPDYKIEKQIQLEGIGRDFAVAKNTGEIVAVTKTDEKYIVKMLALKGNCKWSHFFDKSYYNISAFVSNNGNITTLFLSEGEGRGKNLIISDKGNILFESSFTYNVFHPSPNGKYIYSTMNIMGGNPPKDINLYTTSGIKISLKGLEKLDIQHSGIKFFDENHLIIFGISDSKGICMYFCKLKDNYLDLLWKYNFEKSSLIFNYLYTRNTKISNNKIAVNVNGSGFYIFNQQGDIIYRNKSVNSFCFTDNNKIITDNYNMINIIDIKTNRIKKFKIDLSYFDKTSFLQSISFNDNYLISIRRAFYSKKKHHSLLISNKTIYALNDECFWFSNNFSKNFITIYYKNNSTVSIYNRGN